MPAQIEQVMINLLKNARGIGRAAGQHRAARCSAACGGGCAIEVRDRGAGIQRGSAARTRCCRSIRPSRRGTGLGLTLCREIVEAHGGRLRIANREGGGAVVTLWMPDGS